MDMDIIRKDFPALENWIYLDNAFVGLFPTQVKEGYDLFVDRWMNFSPEVGKTILAEWMEKADEVKAMMADFVGVTREEMAFTSCTGSGLNIIINGLDWEGGDNAVFPEWEHNPLFTHTLKEKGVEVRPVRVIEGEVRIEDLEAAMDDRTKLVQVSQVGYINGFRFDLKEVSSITHDHGAKLLVDATQAVGALDIDYRKDDVDFVSFAPYKYLMGPAGLAFLYVKEENLSQLTPDRVGWKNQIWVGDHAEEAQDLTTAEKFEYGTIHFQGVYALERSIKYLNERGIENISKRNLTLSNYLWEGLVDVGKTMYTPEGTESPIVSFYQDKAEELAQKLMEEGVKVTGRGAHGSHIRGSIHFYNTREDIDNFLGKI
jgi:selenocysteine lyase/cysteine desulfurase